MYYIVLIMSLFNLIMNIIMPFAEEESPIFMFYGEFETWLLIGICAVLLIIRLIMDIANDYKSKYRV